MLKLGTPEPNPTLDAFLHREGYECRRRLYQHVDGCWCGGTNLVQAMAPNLAYDHYQLCTDCGCLILHFVLPEADLAELYGLRYFREHQVAIGSPPFQVRYENDMKDRIPTWLALLRSIRRSGRVLEVGCSHGRLLKELSALGYDVVGLELDEEVAEWTRARTGLDIRRQFIQNLPDGGFDAFFANDVLEHVYNPQDFVAQCLRVLNAGGNALLQTVVFDDWRKCPLNTLRPLYHTILYDASSLPKLVPARASLHAVHPGPFDMRILELRKVA